LFLEQGALPGLRVHEHGPERRTGFPAGERGLRPAEQGVHVLVGADDPSMVARIHGQGDPGMNISGSYGLTLTGVISS